MTNEENAGRLISFESVQLSSYFSHLILGPLKKINWRRNVKKKKTISAEMTGVHTWQLWWLLD